MEVFRELDDDLGLARAMLIMGFVHWSRLRAREAEEARRIALVHAERAGSRALVQELNASLGAVYSHGPAHVDQARAALGSILEQSRGLRLTEGAVQRALGRLAAMQGDFTTGRRLTHAGRAVTADAGLTIEYASNCQGPAFVERLAAGPTRSYASAKQALNRFIYGDLDAQLELEAELQHALGRTSDFLEGAAAFVEKRSPAFGGT